MSPNISISANLEENLKIIDKYIEDCPDIIKKQVILQEKKKGCFIFIKDFVNADLLQRDFIKPLMAMNYSILCNKTVTEYLPSSKLSICDDVDTIIKTVMEGKTAFIIEGASFAVVCNIIEVRERAITEPIGEKNVTSSHDGFIESLDTNITLLRRNIKNHKLKIKTIVLGTITNQNISIVYIKGIANPEIINTLYSKLESIDTDGVLSSANIQQFISDSKHSLFPQYLSTQRVDKTVAALLEGRIAVLLDGTPHALIAPVSFFSFLQSPDDYSSNWIPATLIRLVRFIGLILTLILPGLYIAITSFHYYLVPLNLLVQLGQSRSKVAFPPIIEAILMELTIQMLKEASIRLPTYIGSTIGVVGGIIIGQAAVDAGIVSNLFVIIIGITTVASFIVPSYEFGLAALVLRIVILFMSSLFGIIGLIVCVIVILMHLLSLESLGQPYLMPMTPFKLNDQKDSFVRMPVEFMKKRPHMPKPIDKERGNIDE
jgi:hypothetical protein